MIFQIFSDIHTEHHVDGGHALIRSLNPNGDRRTAIVAGDITTVRAAKDIYKYLGDTFEHTICVLGNHDHWGGGKLPARDITLPSNVHILERDHITLDGIRIHGATGWFPDHPTNILVEDGWADFISIRGLRRWVYKANEDTKEYLCKNVRKGDVVVTHYIPFSNLILPQWRDSAWNRFFVSDFDVVMDNEPKLWVYGHVHDSNERRISSTRFICNPYGYQRKKVNPDFHRELLIGLNHGDKDEKTDE